MFRTIKSTIVSALSFGIIFLSCTKEYSIEKAAGGAGFTGGSAIFSLEGMPGVCASSFLSGSYVAGYAVTSSNTVLLSANVTTIGTYTITTSTANGIVFTGAGSFTTTGLQFIELTASGTAAATGTFNYTSGTTGCSFPVTFTASGGGGTGSGTAVFSFNGAPGGCTTAIVNGVYTAGIALGAGNTVAIAVNVTIAGSYIISTGTANGISFSGSGTLALGAQTITLTGSGIPVGAVTNNFTPGTNGCAFQVTTVASSGSGGSTDYLRCKINSPTTFTNFNTNLSGKKNVPAAGYNTLDISGSASANSSLDLLLAVMGALDTGDYTGTFTSTKSSLPSYIDENSVQWSISFTQTNNFVVTVTAITANRVTGTFSGTLYPLAGTGSVSISNGEFSVPYL